ncbi:hypothetical protein IOD16_36105 [Saccharothrix sp. 6-C]|uniref:Uncharacterized protein n=1 Tax=Saccharothrix texasensis TaxID=103734 RepID=A0A3N1HA70_9PSEU|nr:MULTISPECIES: hypothetical protein [Saccharothrix]QQQ76380.1 hypothetical protein IOD16_36105 [Saccharothrix sp. 6-C]ROP39417.1 hypothetical protein EDD40_4804 [Saccharothrix texasensis]
MYIDETGAADGELKVTVGDEEYTAEATFDLDQDGIEESAVVETDDGGHLAFSDTDGDGDADLMSTFDSDGELTSQAEFDEDSGEWVAVDPSDDRTEQTNTNAGKAIVVDMEGGADQNVGPATEDTDGDGRADTAVVKDEDGDTWLFTDADGDGNADLATEITQDGEVTVSRHTGDDEWTEVEHGRIGEDGKYTPDSDEAWSEQKVTVSGVVRIDSVTGQWISPN